MDDRIDNSLQDFETFFRKTYATMVDYCKSRGQSQEDAEEIVTDAYSRMWNAWERCGDRDTVGRKKWLYKTIDNVIRERNRKHTLYTRDLDEYIDMLGNGVRNDVEAAFENIKYDIYIKRVREILTKSEYEVFKQIVIEQRTYKEAADELGISEDAVRARMMRMREKINLRKNEILK